MKPKLLYLTHRIPYPPNKGDKIRSFHWLKGLASKYDIYLGTFIDTPEDEQYANEVKKYCREVFIERLKPTQAKIKSLTGLFSGQALSVPYYSNSAFQNWVSRCVCDNNIDEALIFSSPMAQFVEGRAFQVMRRVMDFVDIDSDKWQQYATAKSGLMRSLYAREAKKLFQYEKKIHDLFSASVFVSSKESVAFQELISEPSNKITYVNNGVDFNYFSPKIKHDNPYIERTPVLVFTGAMDYWANVDAVVWFVQTVFPQLKAKFPDVMFYIVGSKPAQEVEKLRNIEGVVVTGRVEDVRPYMQYASVVVAPMRIARGIQNKVLEGMAMAKPCVVSDQAWAGIDAADGKELRVANTQAEWVACLSHLLLKDDALKMGEKARQFVIEQFSWANNVTRLIAILQN